MQTQQTALGPTDFTALIKKLRIWWPPTSGGSFVVLLQRAGLFWGDELWVFGGVRSPLTDTDGKAPCERGAPGRGRGYCFCMVGVSKTSGDDMRRR